MMQKISLILLCCTGMTVILVIPVYADPIETTLTSFFIQQDNEPVNDTVDFSVKCYGFYNEYRLKSLGLSKNQNTSSNPELVYSYSVSCPQGSCTRNDQYNPTWGMAISSCDLEGTYKGKEFILKNFTTNPEPDCYGLTEWNISGKRTYFALTFEDLDYCTKKYFSNRKDCVKLLKPIEEGDHPKRLYGFPNGTKLNWTSEFDQCLERSEPEKLSCYETHSRVINQTQISKSHPSLYCELRFNISSENQTSEPTTVPKISSYIPKNPVESLYCSILSFFGVFC